MAMIRPETEMKDSGIEYVGAIPKDWDLVRLRAYFGERKNKNKDGNETNLLSLSYGRIIRKNIDKTDGLLPASFNTYNIVEKNDIIIRPTDLQNDKRSLRTGLVTEHGIITSAYIDLMPIGNVDSRFVHYLLHSYDILKVFYNMGSGVRQGLNYSEFSKLKVPMPPLSEQQAIANYLDETCSKIDEIIAEAKASIDEYKELKQSVLCDTVLRGLNSQIALKNSGASWIGMIPEHWKTVKLKWHLRRMDPKNPGEKEVLSLYRDYGVIPKNSRNDNHNVTSEDTSKYKYVRVGDFVVNKMKAWQGSVAVSDYEGIVSPAYYVYHFLDDVFNKRYFHHLLRSCYKEEFMRLSGGIRIGQWDLSSNALDNIILLVPPKNEQDDIVEYLDNKLPQIDALIAEKESLINDLEAYKKSLIYEVVTGKRRVV